MIATLRHLLRLLRIAWILARHDALFALEHVPVAPVATRLVRWLGRRRQVGRPGERLASALVALGPSFVKFGQSLATRADFLGEEITRDLASLQDRLPPFPVAESRTIIAAELGAPVEKLFRRFDDVPVAAASIAQVHFAETMEGATVAVKVLRPGIEAAFARDLELFRWLARLAVQAMPAFRRLKPVEVVEAFADTVAMEMDLRLEAAAAAELAENFAGDAAFRVPSIDWQRTGRRVLTLERIVGIRIDDIQALRAAGHAGETVLASAARALFNQVFRDGYFHADMHPGNMFVEADGTLVPVDFGVMGRLDKATRYYLADMLVGFLTRDYDRVAAVHFDAGYVPRHKSREAFAQACRSIAEPILGRPLHEISLGRLLAHLFRITETFEMETQPQLLLLQKTMLVAEGVGRRLDPSVNMWQLAQPMVEAWMREHRGPEARAAQMVGEAVAAARQLPIVLRHLDAVLQDVPTARRAEELAMRAAGTGRRMGIAVGLAVGLAFSALIIAILD